MEKKLVNIRVGIYRLHLFSYLDSVNHHEPQNESYSDKSHNTTCAGVLKFGLAVDTALICFAASDLPDREIYGSSVSG